MNLRYFATKAFFGAALVFVLLGLVLVVRSQPVNPQFASPLFIIAPGLVSFSLAVLCVCFALGYLVLERALKHPTSLFLAIVQLTLLLVAAYRNALIFDFWWRLLYGHALVSPRVRPWTAAVSGWATALSLLAFVANAVWSVKSKAPQA